MKKLLVILSTASWIYKNCMFGNSECSRGYYGHHYGCYMCQIGEYNDVENAEWCTPCQEGFTSQEGSTECYKSKSFLLFKFKC